MVLMATYWQLRNRKEQDLLFDTINNKFTAELIKQYILAFKNIQLKLSNVYKTILLEDAEGGTRIERLYRYKRYYETLNEVNTILQKLGQKEIKYYNNNLQEMYNRTVESIETNLKIPIHIPEETVKRSIVNTWCSDGLDWSQRIWRDKSLLKQTLEQGLINCLTTGASSDEFAKLIMDKMNMGYNRAKCIAQTELAHVQNEATISSYREAGIDKVIILTGKDDKVCEECQQVENKPYLISQAPVLPLHPRCRCCYNAVLD